MDVSPSAFPSWQLKEETAKVEDVAQHVDEEVARKQLQEELCRLRSSTLKSDRSPRDTLAGRQRQRREPAASGQECGLARRKCAEGVSVCRGLSLGRASVCLVELAGLLAVVRVGPRVHQQVRHADRRHPPAAPRLCRTDEPVEPPVRRHHVKLRLRGGLRERSRRGLARGGALRP